MPQEQPNRPENRPPRFGGRPPGPPGGEDPNQPPKKGPRFSIYWIYAIIFAILIGFQLFGPFATTSTQINQSQFEDMLKAGDVDKYTIVSNRNLVRLKVKAESLPKYEGEGNQKLGKNLK